MLNNKSYLQKTGLTFLVLFFTLLVGCKNSVTDPTDTSVTSDKAALEKIALGDSIISSFDANYNEEGMMEMAGPMFKTTSEIFPVRVGRKITSVSRDFTLNQLTDTTAEGNLTVVFTGELIIGVTKDTSTKSIDTVISKPFTTTMQRNIKFVKVAHTKYPQFNWRVSASSAIKGGTGSSNIYIKAIKGYLPSGDSVVIADPLNYYFSHGWGRMKEPPTMGMNQDITVVVEVYSVYAAEDFISLTFGAGPDMKNHRTKEKFVLVSDDGLGNKVYSQTFRTHPVRGHSHTVIDAIPAQVIKDDQAPVESSAWGFPYIVK